MRCWGRIGRLSLGVFVLGAALGGASCAPANERPVRGAVPGADAQATAGAPPTLAASDALRFRSIATPSPGTSSEASPSPAASAGPSPSAVASPSTLAMPPIVRTIAPAANGRVPEGAPVTISAVLVGRGADLASASLAVNGADSGAQIDKRNPREWSIHTSQALTVGSHSARLLVRDTSGGTGGFTWQFTVGDSDASPAPAAKPAPASASPVPKPRTP